MSRTKPVADRFHPKVDRSGGPDACWPWTGSRLPSGYGIMSSDGRNGRVAPLRANRISLEIHLGSPIPDGVFVCHRCDNPPCVNPDHLFLGTHLDNMQDKSAKGRHPIGEAHVRAKLTKEGVIEIRRLGALGHTRPALAAQFGVSRALIRGILLRIKWAHV